MDEERRRILKEPGVMLAREGKGGSFIEVWLQPRASKAQITGIDERGLKVSVCSPPVEGKANEELIKLVADVVGVAKSRVTVSAGEKSRNKSIFIAGADPVVVDRKLREAFVDK